MTVQSNQPSWLTVGACSLALSLATGLVTAAIQFGHQESTNETLQAQNQELRKQQEEFSNIIKDWRKAYDNQQAQLQTANARVQNLERDRCTPLVEQVNQLKNYVNNPYSYGYTERQTPDLREVLNGYQQTLRACYSAN
ncbi:hypothetical protein [Pseudomonas syringae]|uniref:hypothetical protein n=1 Tax=Pseudomonas syringae TaxID=317 RepID=UPI0003523F34|nr:hypothetical protein [Pseudomonas syringae]EPF68278.1 Prophage PssSM-03, Orf33 [Pseudomonas syringae pv. syringae SM]